MAKITHFDIGDRWTPQATWTVGATATDPSQIVVRLQDPVGTESVVTTASSPAALTSASQPLARLSQGVFQLSPGIALSSAGYWYLRFEGTGVAEASEEFQAIVDPSEFTSNSGLSDRALVGLSETKDWLQQQNIDTGEDLELVRVINDISQRFHDEAGREFKPILAGTQTRSFPVNQWSRCIFVGDLAVLSTASDAVKVVGSDWTSTIATVDVNYVRGLPTVREAWQPIRELEFNQNQIRPGPGMRVDVKGTWGFPSVPGNLRQAALDAIAVVMDRDVEHYRQDLGSAPGVGEQTSVIVMGSSQPSMLISLPPSAFSVARSYRDPSIGC